MENVRGVVVDPRAPGRLTLGIAPAPAPAPNEAVVRVQAFSLNRGEIRRAQSAEPGWRPGWDLAGIVETAAADGTGPAAGTRVVGLLPVSAWTERVSVPTANLAALPDEVSVAQAATLPVAGLTALHALEKGGSLLARVVLVTGASGGVGHFAVQLARLSGAKVVGLVRQEAHAPDVRRAGATAVVIGDPAGAKAHGPYHLIVESVGGRTLGMVLGLLGPRGVCVNFGVSESESVSFDARAFFFTGGASLYGLYLFPELAREPASLGLGRLASLVADGRLQPRISVEESWTAIGTVAQSLLDRRFPGKAVLHLDA